jgi:glycosyltransferase involved in cell wall biosynthesis
MDNIILDEQKISFVWSTESSITPINPIGPGAGGAENYTIGQVRELISRNIDVEIITVGFGTDDGRDYFPDIKFRSMTPSQVSLIENTIVFVMIPMDIKTIKQSYVILHCSPPPNERGEKSFYVRAVKGKAIIVPSKYAASLWADYFGYDIKDISVVYPFAEYVFSKTLRTSSTNKNKRRVLVANRLSPEKGIYTFLASLHFDYILDEYDYSFTVVAVGAESKFRRIIEPLLRAHPDIKVIEPLKSPKKMAETLVNYDIVVVPSNSQFWHETFGIISVEAQHAGCRVVASDDGGLPETNCSGLVLVEPDNAIKLALGIAEAARLGPLDDISRTKASKNYTVKQSVDSLLSVLKFSHK